MASVEPHALFPTEGKTPYGDWVKAGALKEGDKVSTLGSIKRLAEVGPTVEAALKLKAANDDPAPAKKVSQAGIEPAALTVKSIKRLDDPVSVFNLEIESRPGEITHSYLVGDDLAWAHNQPKDKRFGLPNKFWRWYHRKIKRPGDPDCDLDEALDYFREWEGAGSPDGDNNRGGRRGGRR